MTISILISTDTNPWRPNPQHLTAWIGGELIPLDSFDFKAADPQTFVALVEDGKWIARGRLQILRFLSEHWNICRRCLRPIVCPHCNEKHRCKTSPT